MITNLKIQNYALIDNLDITFEKGFSVITGETGNDSLCQAFAFTLNFDH